MTRKGGWSKIEAVPFFPEDKSAYESFIASNHINDTNDIFHHSLSRENQDTRLRMPFHTTSSLAAKYPAPLLLGCHRLDSLGRERYSRALHLVSQVNGTYNNLNDTSVFLATLFRTLKQMIGGRWADSADTIKSLHLVAAEWECEQSRQLYQNRDAQYNQHIQNELDMIIHSSSMIPAQRVHQQNYNLSPAAVAFPLTQ